MQDLSYQATRRSPEELIRHLQNFELNLRFSAGIWFFSGSNSRFHTRYGREMSIEERLEKFSGLKKYGLEGIEAHYPNEINEHNLPLYKDFCRDTGMKVVAVVPNLFYEEQYCYGSLSSPLPVARQSAIQRVKETLEINKELGTEFMVVWPGIDGYENPFGIDFSEMRHRFAAGLAEAMDAVPGIRVAMEPKPYEPRGRIIYGTTAEGILLAEKVEGLLQNPVNKELLQQGYTLLGLNPEIGHVIMGYEDLPYALSLPLEYSRLVHTHWNSQPLGNYDQDLNVGVIAPEQAEAALYVLKMHGYQGWFGLDINPERMPVERAVINSMDAIRAMNDRINNLDHELVVACVQDPERYAGYLEALLIRARARNTEILSPLSLQGV
ncbi:TIM barrel protein [Neomoorella thermoacetica]|uniref:TIM barrel protein n=1 Tax=Neomoorella thermoacetica TaxID=1525 RepID=UPI0008FB49E6|nr:TIM barrel protein [Moorella thermoacetica]OIQ62622.1 xylose isomerase [Moorella thermoacetica]